VEKEKTRCRKRGSGPCGGGAHPSYSVLSVFGILWFGRVLNVYSTLHRAAHDAAQAYGSNTCGSCGNNLPSQTTVMDNVVKPILYSAHLNPSQVTPNFTRPALLNPTSTPVEVGTTVDLTYTYPLKLDGLACCPLTLTTLMDGIRISAHGQARQVKAQGMRPSGAPLPMVSPETGYYGILMLKEPAWTWEIPLYFFVGERPAPLASWQRSPTTLGRIRS
jgi:hypothetical protein